MFECLKWNGETMQLDNWHFSIESVRNPNASETIENTFGLFKNKQMFEQYEKIFSERANFQAKHIFEIGVWNGGSLVIWNEVFKPAKLVGVDFRADRSDNNYLHSYVDRQDVEDTVKIYWGIDQSDRRAILEICAREFSGELDLIIDDASHYYEESKASFEILFPKLRQGGLYIIEDWAWTYWPEYDEHPYFDGKAALSKLVVEIAEMIGSARGVAPATLTVLPGLVAVEKGMLNIPLDQPFYIDKQIRQRPHSTLQPPPTVRKLG